jgi:hypothetical protein
LPHADSEASNPSQRVCFTTSTSQTRLASVAFGHGVPPRSAP